MPRRGAGRGLPGRRGHPTPHVARERRRRGRRTRPRNGATAPRLRGSVTESSATISGTSPGRARRVEQVVGVGVLVRRDPRARPWCAPPRYPVELRPRHLEQRDAASRPRPERLAQPGVALGALGDVQRGNRYAGPQRLDHRVAPGDPLVVASPSLRGWRRRARSRSLARSAAFARLCALWLARSSAFGVGPLPSSPRRTRPPDPAVGFPAASSGSRPCADYCLASASFVC